MILWQHEFRYSNLIVKRTNARCVWEKDSSGQVRAQHGTLIRSFRKGRRRKCRDGLGQMLFSQYVGSPVIPTGNSPVVKCVN